jgi:hypothetical protein
MDLPTRRAFLASIAAAIAAGSTRLPAGAAVPSFVPELISQPVRLYVHHECGGLLSFGRTYDEDSPTGEWTWRQYIMHTWNGNPGTEKFDKAGLAYAKECFIDWTGVSLDEEDDDYGEYATRERALAAFEQWLEEPHPGSGSLEGAQYEWWACNDSATAQAADLLSMLDLDVPEDTNGYGEDDGIVIEHHPDPRVVVDERGLERIRKAIRQHGLHIEVVETT